MISFKNLFFRPSIDPLDQEIMTAYEFALSPGSMESDRDLERKAVDIRQERINAGIKELTHDWFWESLEAASTDEERVNIYEKYYQCTHLDKLTTYIFIDKEKRRIEVYRGDKGTACAVCKHIKSIQRMPKEEEYRIMRESIRFLKNKYRIK